MDPARIAAEMTKAFHQTEMFLIGLIALMGIAAMLMAWLYSRERKRRQIAEICLMITQAALKDVLPRTPNGSSRYMWVEKIREFHGGNVVDATGTLTGLIKCQRLPDSPNETGGFPSLWEFAQWLQEHPFP